MAYFPMLRGSVGKEETFSQNFASIGFYLQGRDRSQYKTVGCKSRKTWSILREVLQHE